MGCYEGGGVKVKKMREIARGAVGDDTRVRTDTRSDPPLELDLKLLYLYNTCVCMCVCGFVCDSISVCVHIILLLYIHTRDSCDDMTEKTTLSCICV